MLHRGLPGQLPPLATSKAGGHKHTAHHLFAHGRVLLFLCPVLIDSIINLSLGLDVFSLDCDHGRLRR